MLSVYYEQATWTRCAHLRELRYWTGEIEAVVVQEIGSQEIQIRIRGLESYDHIPKDDDMALFV